MNRRPQATGFTLTELAVVLAILGLLLGGMLMPLASQMDMRNRQETDKALAAIQESLIGFALINGRLPCPATPTLASGTGGDCPSGGNAAAAGCEATTGNGATLACVADTGVLPWATLGLPEVDAWGNRYSYGVTLRFARGLNPSQTDFGSTCPLNPFDRSSYDPALSDGPRQAALAICTPGDMAVLNGVNGTTLASGLPAVVVSHGKNGAGAYTTQGLRIPSAPAGSAEAENSDDNRNFISSAAIDDQLAWIPRPLLIGRMIAAGKLP